MNTKFRSAFCIQHSAFAFMAALALLTTAPRVHAQTGWGNALYFDGADDHVVITDFGAAVPTNEVTVEFWQRVHSVAQQSTFTLYPDDPTNRFQAHVPWENGMVYWDYGDISGDTLTNGRLAYLPPAPLINTWQHFALVATTGPSGTMHIYRNGVLEADKTNSISFSGGGSINLVLGWNPLDDVFYAGELDEFRVWNVARSAVEIQANMSRPLTGEEPNLLLYYRFDEDTGTMIYDATTNHFDGTLVDGPAFVAHESRDVDVNFGLVVEYDNGVTPCVAINDANVVVGIHKSQDFNDLWYHVGWATNGTVAWGNSVKQQSGWEPSITINNQNTVVEVHAGNNNLCWSTVGTVSGNTIIWQAPVNHTQGMTPSVALNNSNVVVHVARTNSGNALYYMVGQLAGNSIIWTAPADYAEGSDPCIALNDKRDVVAVHGDVSGTNLYYCVGKVSGTNISWGPISYYGVGARPFVTLRDDGYVIEAHDSAGYLARRIGLLSGTGIAWRSESVSFYDGIDPSVACNDQLVILTHYFDMALRYFTSLLNDRSCWMQDRLSTLGDRTLKQLVMPASHDAAMNETTDGPGYCPKGYGQCQHLSIYNQLKMGIRYFDVRPAWFNGPIWMLHGVPNGLDCYYRGETLGTVLDDVRQFMTRGDRELVILKFSHYWNLDGTNYMTMAAQITDVLGPWLFHWSSLPQGKRLADVTLAEYVPYQGTVLVVCDGDYPVSNPADGIWVYRDWNNDPYAGWKELRVFDEWSNKKEFKKMRSDQFLKFTTFDGNCAYGNVFSGTNYSGYKCTTNTSDLFLLSWTCTPAGLDDVWAVSVEPNRLLALAMTELPIPNTNGFVPNILYVDYVEYARVCDVALYLNGCPDIGPEWIAPPRLQARHLGNQVELQIESLPGKPLEIEQTTDLANPVWTPIQTVTITTVPQVLTVPASPVPQAFWRAVVH